jgi:hypothetical protein
MSDVEASLTWMARAANPPSHFVHKDPKKIKVHDKKPDPNEPPMVLTMKDKSDIEIVRAFATSFEDMGNFLARLEDKDPELQEYILYYKKYTGSTPLADGETRAMFLNILLHRYPRLDHWYTHEFLPREKALGLGPYKSPGNKKLKTTVAQPAPAPAPVQRKVVLGPFETIERKFDAGDPTGAAFAACYLVKYGQLDPYKYSLFKYRQGFHAERKIINDALVKAGLLGDARRVEEEESDEDFGAPSDLDAAAGNQQYSVVFDGAGLSKASM